MKVVFVKKNSPYFFNSITYMWLLWNYDIFYEDGGNLILSYT